MATDDEIDAALQAANAHVVDLAESPNGELRGILKDDVHQMVLDVLAAIDALRTIPVVKVNAGLPRAARLPEPTPSPSISLPATERATKAQGGRLVLTETDHVGRRWP